MALQLKRSTSRDVAKRQARQDEIAQAHRDYLAAAERFLERARHTRIRLHLACRLPDALLAALDAYIAHGERQIEQIHRRVLCGQRIPHEEKAFSIFQPHTEWISKGKAGVPVELGCAWR